MAQPKKISDAQLARLIDEGRTYKEIADMYGLTPSWIYRQARQAGLVSRRQDRLSHKRALPWQVRRQHSAGRIARYLRVLSSTAQGKETSEYDQRVALRWAKEMIRQGLDVDYDESRAPSEFSSVGGFYSKPRPPRAEEWHILQVYKAAIRALNRRPL